MTGYAVFLVETATRLPQVRISVKQVVEHIKHSPSTAPAGVHQVQHLCILKQPRELLARHGWSRVGVGVSLDIQRIGERELSDLHHRWKKESAAWGRGDVLEQSGCRGPLRKAVLGFHGPDYVLGLDWELGEQMEKC